MDQNSLFGTLVDIDIDTTTGASNDLPGWLREILDRALNAAGVRSNKKVASHGAIASLQELDLNQAPSPDCPICFDKYEIVEKANVLSVAQETEKAQKHKESVRQRDETRLHNERMTQELRSKCNINIQSSVEAGGFSDPSVYFPIDQAAMNYCRFPQRNLHTLMEPTEDDILPGYNDVTKEENKKKSYEDLVKSAGHIPVKMPSCGHIFGKSCIIEWLKSNVSCPLCRKEVEESKEKDTKQQKLERVTNSIYSQYNDHDVTLHHLLHHTTDVFNPFRRPFNPTVTPLTDSYIPQVLATPTCTLNGNNYEQVSAKEPNLVLAGQFPLAEYPMTSTRTFTIRRGRPPTNTETRGATEPSTGPNDISSDDPFSPDSMSESSSSENEFNSVASGSNSDISRAALLARTGSRTGSGSGAGGPERSRRSPRSHPYSRPN